MKKITLLLATVLISATMYGQFHIGPQIGYTTSDLSYNMNNIKASMQSNMVIGVFMRIGNKIYLQPEINYITQGSVFKFPSSGSIPPVEQKVQLKSIQIPLSLGAQVINLKIIKLRVFAGATANFVTNKIIDPVTDAPKDYLQPDNFKNVNFQYQIGAGVDILMFALDVKYYGGISNLVNGSVKYNSANTTINGGSNVFMVTLGWKLF